MPFVSLSPTWLRSSRSDDAEMVVGQRHKALDADLVRTIHGFDALLVLTGSTASANLYPSRFMRFRRAISRTLGASRIVSPTLISPSRS